jgi:hypothetical protein
MRPQALRWLSAADWLDAARARAWRNVLLVLSALAIVVWCALSRHGVDVTGKPLGTDFASFYAASRLTLSGHPAAAYDVASHHAAQSAIFSRDLGYAAFFYPPLFLLICAPLGLLPYLASLAVWLGATGAAFLAAMRGWLGEGFGLAAVLAFPALLLNLGHGQNAFLSAALLGAGALALNPRPILAGVALGLLAYKPQLGLMIPVALIAARRWTTLAAAAATVLLMAAASLALFGVETWQDGHRLRRRAGAGRAGRPGLWGAGGDHPVRRGGPGAPSGAPSARPRRRAAADHRDAARKPLPAGLRPRRPGLSPGLAGGGGRP